PRASNARAWAIHKSASAYRARGPRLVTPANTDRSPTRRRIGMRRAWRAHPAKVGASARRIVWVFQAACAPAPATTCRRERSAEASPCSSSSTPVWRAVAPSSVVCSKIRAPGHCALAPSTTPVETITCAPASRAAVPACRPISSFSCASTVIRFDWKPKRTCIESPVSRKQIKQQRKQAKLHKRGKLDKKRRQAHAHRDARGQVHLELHRDPLSGNAQVVLRQAIFEHAWQNQLAVATATTAHTLLQPEPTLEQVAELARNVMGATSRLAEGLLTRAPAGSVACKAGCDHCCYQPVGVTAPEALAIFDHLKQTRSVEALAQLTAHVAKRHEQTRDLSAAERFSPEQPCPFLESGHCSVYEVRPLACR